MALESLDIRRRSASQTSAPDVRKRAEVAKLIDISRCIGCKACQAACMEWNEVRDDVGALDGTYDNPIDLTGRTWTVMRFYEEELADRGLQWLIVKDGCLHCADPGCLKACPAPGAIVQYSNGIVDFQQDNCIGCGYCQTGCATASTTTRPTSARSAPTAWRSGSSRRASRPARPRRSASGRRRT
jgi:formate dehydrogenase iron-sulfur subunit